MKHLSLFILFVCLSHHGLIFSQESTVQIDYTKENENLFLAATKLCWDYDYNAAFGYKRVKASGTDFVNNKPSTYKKNCCTQFIPAPYVSPMEYYFHLFENDNRILENKTNTFKLKAIRKQLQDEKFEGFKDKVMEVDTQNLISYTIAHATIQDYDFETNKLRLSYSMSASKGIKKNSKFIAFPKLSEHNQVFYPHYILLEENKAKDIYDYYAKTQKLNTNPPFRLKTKTTFIIKKPLEIKSSYRFQGIIKKIEFYLKSDDQTIDPKLKIGEVIFEETLHLNKYKRYYQNVISNSN